MGNRHVAGRATTAVTAALAAALTAVTAVAALAAPAGAEGAAVDDPVGDTTRVNQDITRLKVRNGETTVAVRVRFDSIDPSRRTRVRVLVDPAPRDTTQYILQSVKRPGVDGRTWLLLAVGMEFDGTPVPCDGLRGRWDLDRATVRVSLPQACLPENGRLHAFKATTVFGGRTGDWTDFLRVRRGSSSATA